MNEPVTTNQESARTGAFASLRDRAIFGILAFAIVIGVLRIGWTLMLPVLAFAAFQGLREFRGMTFRHGLELSNQSAYWFGTFILIASLPVWPQDVPWREFVVAASVIAMLVGEVIRPSGVPLERVVYSFFGIIYIPYLMSYALLLRYTPNDTQGFWYLLLVLLGAYASDTGAYFAGGLFGKTKLAPEISPSKTIEGAIGGLVFSFLFVFLLSESLRAFAPPGANVYDALIFSLLVSSTAQLGDLAESVIKRSLGAKDSGNFLPGHGGILDRMDSILFALPVAYYFLKLAVF